MPIVIVNYDGCTSNHVQAPQAAGPAVRGLGNDQVTRDEVEASKVIPLRIRASGDDAP